MAGSFPDYECYDATGLAGLVARGEVSPLELVEAAAERRPGATGVPPLVRRDRPATSPE